MLSWSVAQLNLSTQISQLTATFCSSVIIVIRVLLIYILNTYRSLCNFWFSSVQTVFKGLIDINFYSEACNEIYSLLSSKARFQQKMSQSAVATFNHWWCHINNRFQCVHQHYFQSYQMCPKEVSHPWFRCNHCLWNNVMSNIGYWDLPVWQNQPKNTFNRAYLLFCISYNNSVIFRNLSRDFYRSRKNWLDYDVQWESYQPSNY